MVLGALMHMFTIRREEDVKVKLIELNEENNSIMAQESDLEMYKSQSEDTFNELIAQDNYNAFQQYGAIQSRNSSRISELNDQLKNTKDPHEQEKIRDQMKAIEKENENARSNIIEGNQLRCMLKTAEFKRTQGIAFQMKMQQLKRKEKQIAQTKVKLESQASIFAAQKESYAQLATTEAKESAPKFGNA